jgi:hypothetical protein
MAIAGVFRVGSAVIFISFNYDHVKRFYQFFIKAFLLFRNVFKFYRKLFNKAFSKVFHTLLSRVFIRTSNMELLCDVGVPGLVFNRMIF